MKNINVTDLNDMNVNPIEAADVKGGPHFRTLGDINRVRSEQITLGYTEVEWTY